MFKDDLDRILETLDVVKRGRMLGVDDLVQAYKKDVTFLLKLLRSQESEILQLETKRKEAIQ